MKITQDSNLDRIEEQKEQMRFLSIFCDQVTTMLNNGLLFSDNFNQKTLSVTFSAVNTDTAINHGLGRVPQGYIVIGRSANLVVYNGASQWTSSLIYLRSSALGSANMFVF